MSDVSCASLAAGAQRLVRWQSAMGDARKDLELLVATVVRNKSLDNKANRLQQRASLNHTAKR
jgi:hypothetical protein